MKNESEKQTVGTFELWARIKYRKGDFHLFGAGNGGGLDADARYFSAGIYETGPEAESDAETLRAAGAETLIEYRPCIMGEDCTRGHLTAKQAASLMGEAPEAVSYMTRCGMLPEAMKRRHYLRIADIMRAAEMLKQAPEVREQIIEASARNPRREWVQVATKSASEILETAFRVGILYRAGDNRTAEEITQ